MGELVANPSITALRQAVYQTFSDCFLHWPSLESLSFLADAEWRQRASALTGPELENMYTDLRGGPDNGRLAIEYAALFRIPGPQHTFPFEHHHRERPPAHERTRPPSVLESAVAQVAAIYQRWRLPSDLETRELPEHAGLELRFMSLLTGAERLSRESQDDEFTTTIVLAEADFLERHILQWFPQWLQQLHDCARQPFYRSAARALRGFLQTEKTAFNALRRVPGRGHRP